MTRPAAPARNAAVLALTGLLGLLAAAGAHAAFGGRTATRAAAGPVEWAAFVALEAATALAVVAWLALRRPRPGDIGGPDAEAPPRAAGGRVGVAYAVVAGAVLAVSSLEGSAGDVLRLLLLAPLAGICGLVGVASLWYAGKGSRS